MYPATNVRLLRVHLQFAQAVLLLSLPPIAQAVPLHASRELARSSVSNTQKQDARQEPRQSQHRADQQDEKQAEVQGRDQEQEQLYEELLTMASRAERRFHGAPPPLFITDPNDCGTPAAVSARAAAIALRAAVDCKAAAQAARRATKAALKRAAQGHTEADDVLSPVHTKPYLHENWGAGVVANANIGAAAETAEALKRARQNVLSRARVHGAEKLAHARRLVRRRAWA